MLQYGYLLMIKLKSSDVFIEPFQKVNMVW